MRLNKIFRSHMVFARNNPIRVYGDGQGTVSVNFAGNIKTITADKDKWLIEFPSMDYGGPYEMEVVLNGEKIVLEDIYVGEVYLLAGQSNLQFKLHESTTPKEMYESNNKLRLYTTDRIEKNEYYTSDDGWLVADIAVQEKFVKTVLVHNIHCLAHFHLLRLDSQSYCKFLINHIFNGVFVNMVYYNKLWVYRIENYSFNILQDFRFVFARSMYYDFGFSLICKFQLLFE